MGNSEVFPVKDAPVLDHTRLKLPSDDMKLEVISKRIKKLHTGNLGQDLESVDFIMLDAYAVMDVERRIAEQAFARELGRPDPYRDDNFSTREELIKELAKEYQEYGISSGPAHTKELVHSIEQQAATQAREYRGQGR